MIPLDKRRGTNILSVFATPHYIKKYNQDKRDPQVWIENVPDPSGNCLFSQVNETIATLIATFNFCYGKNRPLKETPSTDTHKYVAADPGGNLNKFERIQIKYLFV